MLWTHQAVRQSSLALGILTSYRMSSADQNSQNRIFCFGAIERNSLTLYLQAHLYSAVKEGSSYIIGQKEENEALRGHFNDNSANDAQYANRR